MLAQTLLFVTVLSAALTFAIRAAILPAAARAAIRRR